MDPLRFDRLARSFATPKTRRGLIGSVAALVAGAVGLRGVGAQVTQRDCGNVTCANNPGRCNPGCVCCLYPNGNSRCRPPGTCSPGRESCPADLPVFDPARGCVQCLDASQCPPPSDECAVAACVDGGCTTTVSDDGATCPGGVCVGGVCCDSGSDLPGGGEICDALNGGFCCSGGLTCCGDPGCCSDCFVEDGSSTLCCEEAALCPPRSESNPEPPHCCRLGEVCVADGSQLGCYPPDRVCNGQYCDAECCGGTTCCQDGTYCAGGSCVAVPALACTEDADCGAGLSCVDVVRVLLPPEEEGGEPTLLVQPGTCCQAARFCDIQGDEFGVPNAICCPYGQQCNGSGICCNFAGCSPRGSRTRL